MSKGDFYYATKDRAIIEAFLTWKRDRDAWGLKIEAIARRYRRQAVVSELGGERFAALTRKKHEGSTSSDFAGTMFVLTEGGHLRPRMSHKDGKKLDAEMRACGGMRDWRECLRGIPKMYGFLGRPGGCLSKDQTTLVLHYLENVKHDERWTPIKASEYHAVVESHDDAKTEEAVA